MKTVMMYLIVGCLFTGIGFQNCPGPNVLHNSDYALDIILWPISLIGLLFIIPERACK